MNEQLNEEKIETVTTEVVESVIESAPPVDEKVDALREALANDPVIKQWTDNYNDHIFNKRFERPNVKPLSYLHQGFYYNKVPVVMLAAGPSLDYNIQELKNYQQNVVIGCVDMSLYAVQQAGIVPDFVISVDSSVYISEMWKACNTEGLTLICSTTTHPETIDCWKGNIFLYNQLDLKDDPKGVALANLIQPTLNYGGILNRFFVGATALQVLDMFKPNIVIVAGCDFAYRENKIYCQGVLESRLQSLAGTPQYEIEKNFRIKRALDSAFTFDGIMTSEALSGLYLNTFFGIIQGLKLQIINSTEGGILNYNNMPLKDSLKRFCFNKIRKYDVFKPKIHKRKKKK